MTTTDTEKSTNKLTGAQIFLECLKKEGVDKIFGYPGGVILTIYEALYNCDFITSSAFLSASPIFEASLPPA